MAGNRACWSQVIHPPGRRPKGKLFYSHSPPPRPGPTAVEWYSFGGNRQPLGSILLGNISPDMARDPKGADWAPGVETEWAGGPIRKSQKFTAPILGMLPTVQPPSFQPSSHLPPMLPSQLCSSLKWTAGLGSSVCTLLCGRVLDLHS